MQTVTDEPLTASVHLIPIDQLVPSPTNPRKHFDPRELEELAASVRDKGRKR